MMLKLASQFKRAKPFRPFRVVMRSGKRFDICDPERVVVTPRKVIAFLPRMTEMPETEIELVYVPRHS